MALDPDRYFIIIRTCSATACRGRRATLSARDRLRQCPAATPSGDGKILQTLHWARSIPTCRAHRAVLRLGQTLAPQFRIPRRREGGAHLRRPYNGGWYKEQP